MPHADPQRILFIDAYDSFTNNIVSLLEKRLQVKVTVIRIDDPIKDFASFIRPFAAIVAGPGPGDPRNPMDVGLFRELWKLDGDKLLPVLGICLGFQSLVQAFGGIIDRLPEPRHGIVRKVRFNNDSDFACSQEVETVQYHSLHASLKHRDENTNVDHWKSSAACPELQPLAWDYNSDNKPDATSEILSPSPQRVLMAVRHVSNPFFGIQFHAESICSSEDARRVIDDWWAAARAWTRYSWQMRDIRDTPRIISSAFVSDEKFWAAEKTRPSKPQRTHPNAESVLKAIDGNVDKRKPLSNDRKDPSTGEISSPHARTTQRTQKVHVDTKILDVEEWTIPSICGALHLTEGESVILDSEQHQRPEVGEYSILGIVLPESLRFEHTAGTSDIRRTSGGHGSNLDLAHYPGGIITYLKDFLKQYRPQSQNVKIPFWGGLVGYIGYEACLEMIGINNRPDSEPRNLLRGPNMSFVFVERSIVIDHFNQKMYIQSIKPNDHEWVNETTSRLRKPSKSPLSSVCLCPKTSSPDRPVQIDMPDETTYKSQVRACQDSIRAGDSYELCLTTQATIKAPIRHQPWALYRRLRNLNPSPFSAYVRLGNMTLLSSSPERFLRWSRPTTGTGFDSDKKISTCQFRPIKGTVKRQPDPNLPPLTLAQATALLSTPKERAENLMIVDLIRHDLHGVVGSGNVTVPKLMVVEEYATLFQLVSVIEGTLTIMDDDNDEDDELIEILNDVPNESDNTNLPTSPNLPSTTQPHPPTPTSPIDILASSLPPGSMTGAPKLRSCQLLRSLENRNRGTYSGVLGYLDIGGGGDFSVVIRSAVRWDKAREDGAGEGEDDEVSGEVEEEEGEEWTIGAGGAVTALSTEEGEWEEMVAKLKSTLRLFTE
ncbi:hypothetical protein JMJ35_004651 [Cladonia borealis]|uniref:aminodeoxychorismate synthase n=1 Tax=Cladonia borealis TaxID=184061 RepID=A0AA39R2H8_9LECA|nr:hypothetical protein JMJ35_004651 [Cladonia borealis]